MTTTAFPAGLHRTNPSGTVGPPSRFLLDPEWARQAARPMRRLISGPVEPRWPDLEHIARSLMATDRAGADLAAAIGDGQIRMKQFRQALASGVAAVPQAPAALVDFFAEVEALPGWVDDELLRRGARVVRRSGLNAADVMNTALLSGYRSSADSQLLVRTGGLTGDGAIRRLAETAKWWHECVQAEGMDRERPGWQLTVHVRVMHALVNRYYEQSGTWDSATWGRPINQADQAATLGLFCTYYLLAIRSLGIPVSAADGQAVMHLWRYIGWLMGVSEEWLPLDEQDGRRTFYRLSLTVPPPDENSVLLARSLLASRKHLSFNRFQTWRRRYEHAKLRSLSSALVGRSGMREMGLRPVLPWYHAVRVPTNAVKHRLARQHPRLEQRLLDRGGRELTRSLTKHFGPALPAVGPHPHT